jgi:hypothetical protein
VRRLEAEVAHYVERLADERDEEDKQLVVRNGRARERRVTAGSGTVAVCAPRVNDKRVDEESGEFVGSRLRYCRHTHAGRRRSTTSCRCCPCAACRPAPSARLEQLLGGGRCRAVCVVDQPAVQGLRGRAPRASKRGRCAFYTYAYCFVDGVHVSGRLGEDDRLCLLVVIGVREDSVKKQLAVEDGYREQRVVGRRFNKPSS